MEERLIAETEKMEETENSESEEPTLMAAVGDMGFIKSTTLKHRRGRGREANSPS
jgi:hypothetical protein